MNLKQFFMLIFIQERSPVNSCAVHKKDVCVCLFLCMCVCMHRCVCACVCVQMVGLHSDLKNFFLK